MDKAKRVQAAAQITGLLASSGHAPPPAKMSAALRDQWSQSQRASPEEIHRKIQRLTTKNYQPTTSLTKKDSKKLRGK